MSKKSRGSCPLKPEVDKCPSFEPGRCNLEQINLLLPNGKNVHRSLPYISCDTGSEVILILRCVCPNRDRQWLKILVEKTFVHRTQTFQTAKISSIANHTEGSLGSNFNMKEKRSENEINRRTPRNMASNRLRHPLAGSGGVITRRLHYMSLLPHSYCHFFLVMFAYGHESRDTRLGFWLGRSGAINFS
jgi:hypothetical protein